MLSWQQATASVMAGPRASPLFRDTSSQLECYWQIYTQTHRPLYLDPDMRQRALELSLIGTNLGWSTYIQGLLEDVPILDAMRRISYTISHPGFSLVRDTDRFRIRWNDDPTHRRVARARVDEPQRRGKSTLYETRVPPSSLRLSSTISLVDPNAWMASDEEEVSTEIEPQYIVSLQSQRLGPTAMRVELAAQPERRRGWELAGIFVVRQELHPRLGVFGDLRWSHEAVLLRRAGLELYPHSDQDLLIRTTLSKITKDPNDIPEQRLMLTLRRRLRWHLPQDISRWPLGQEPGHPGPWLPTIEDRSPNTLELINATPHERHQDQARRRKNP